MKKLLLAAAVALSCAAAQAQLSAEIGYAATTIKVSEAGDNVKSSLGAIRGLIGYEFHPNLGLEGMLAFGLSDGDVSLNGRKVPGVNFKIESILGVYVKPKLKLSDDFEVFARIGYADLRGKTTAPGYSESSKDSSASYGVGLSYAIDKTYSVNADYMSYVNKNGTKSDGWTLGVGFKF